MNEDVVPKGIQEILKLAEDEGYIEIVKEKEDEFRSTGVVMSNEEFEEIFGNVPFENIAKIRDWVNEHYVSKDKIREKIEEKEKQKEEVPHEMDFRAFYRISDLKEVEIGALKELL